jgi:hypothetical protein
MAGVAHLRGFKIGHEDLIEESTALLTRFSSHQQVKQTNIIVDGAGIARVGNIGLVIMADLSTAVLSETAVSPGRGTCG